MGDGRSGRQVRRRQKIEVLALVDGVGYLAMGLDEEKIGKAWGRPAQRAVTRWYWRDGSRPGEVGNSVAVE